MVAVDVKHHVYLLTATMMTVFHKQHTALWTDHHQDDSISQTTHSPLNWPPPGRQYFTNNTQPSELTSTMVTVFHKQHTALWTEQHYGDSISQTTHSPLNWPALWWQYFTNNTQPSEMTTMMTVFHKQHTALWTEHDYDDSISQATQSSELTTTMKE